MSYVEFAPAELLSLGFSSPEITDTAWCVRWDGLATDPAEIVLETMPPTTDFLTSGTTGPPQPWRRRREKMWLEAGMLAGFVVPERPEAVVSFVPPMHLYGALATVLMPAQLRLPVWYRSSFLGAMPAVPARRLVVAAIPWTFQLLLSHLGWVKSFEQVTVLHGGGTLPATAGDLMTELGPGRGLIVELFGSTEAGGIATRRWRDGEPPPWTLFQDVSFAEPDVREAVLGGTSMPDDGGGVPLVVRSPRLAFRPGEEPAATLRVDDFVEPLDDRTFRLVGRRTRLVKVNGRRINLDQVEHALHTILDCEDLALLPVADRMIGEHVDLLLVLKRGTTLADLDLKAAFTAISVRPRKVQVVTQIDRSETGKLRQVQTSPTIHSEVVS